VLGYRLFEEKPVGDFTRFIFRNSGDDWPDAFFRDAFMQELMRDHMANGRQSFQPVVTFLNGDYFGLLNLRDKLDESCFPLQYDVEPEDVDYWEMEFDGVTAFPQNSAGTPDSWTSLFAFMAANDLAIAANYEAVKSDINIEDLIDMVIVEAFVGNTSWFHNRKWWRDRGPEGKWRWTPFDLDPDGTRADIGAFSFDSSQGYLVINEIHYHPAQGVSNDFEFIELTNPGGAALNVFGFSFSDGIVFTFPAAIINPGEYILVCRDAANYAGLGFQVFEWSAGVLDNIGEKIRLIDAASNEVDRVDYDDAAPWPTEADGFGPSLSLISPFMDNRLGESLQASCSLSGTPGVSFDGQTVSNLAVIGGGDLAIETFSHPDLAYTLLCSEDLMTQQWTVSEGPLQGNGAFVISPDGEQTQRFYRIQSEYK